MTKPASQRTENTKGNEMKVSTLALKLQNAVIADVDRDLIDRLSQRLSDMVIQMQIDVVNPKEVNAECKAAGVSEDFWPFS